MVRSEVRIKHQLVADVEGEMLKRIRLRAGLSRVELARELRLSPTTSGVYVDRLIQQGVLREQAGSERRRGRQPTILQPAPDAGLFVGVDFEAHNLRVMVVDFALGSVKRVHQAVPPEASVADILGTLGQAVRRALRGDRRRLFGIGIGVPGSIDRAAGTASDFPFIAGWQDVPIVARLTQEFGVPVRIENNIRSMAMAELWFGQGFGLRNFVCLGIRTGIGAGVVANGELVTGEHGAAGQVGRWYLPAPDAAGVLRSLESVASLEAILRQAGAGGRPLTLPQLAAAARKRDRRVVRLLHHAAAAHAWAAHQLQLLFDPQRIIIMGPLTGLGAVVLDPMQAALRALRPQSAEPEVVHSTLGDFCGAYGAAALAVHEWKPVRAQ